MIFAGARASRHSIIMSKAMQPEHKIYVAGHRGLVGSAIMRHLKGGGYSNIVTRTHAELDLMDQHAVRDFFCAGKTGSCFSCGCKSRRNSR